MEAYTGKYDASKLNYGNPPEIVVSLKYDESNSRFAISFLTNSVVMSKICSSGGHVNEVKEDALDFLNQARIEMLSFFDVPLDAFETVFQANYFKKNWTHLWHFKSLVNGKSLIDRRTEWANKSSVDMCFPDTKLTSDQQTLITEMCNSKIVILSEGYDESYGLMYFELQPSTFLGALKFAFKQLSPQEEYETVRKSKECCRCAMRVLFPIVDIITQYCEDVGCDRLLDLVEGKTDIICLKKKQ